MCFFNPKNQIFIFIRALVWKEPGVMALQMDHFSSFLFITHTHFFPIFFFILRFNTTTKKIMYSRFYSTIQKKKIKYILKVVVEIKRSEGKSAEFLLVVRLRLPLRLESSGIDPPSGTPPRPPPPPPLPSSLPFILLSLLTP